MDSIMDSGNVDIEFLLKKVSTIENLIFKSIREGSPEYLKFTNIKEESAYANPHSSSFLYYSLWTDVLAAKYNDVPPPPYSAIKVPLDLNNQTNIKNFISNIEDKELADRFALWIKTKRKTSLTNIALPRVYVENNGVPPELRPAIAARKMVYETVQPFYLLLESLGIYMIGDTNILSRLVSDEVLPFDDSSFLFK